MTYLTDEERKKYFRNKDGDPLMMAVPTEFVWDMIACIFTMTLDARNAEYIAELKAEISRLKAGKKGSDV